ncbi:MAG: EAL domain-containing protein [Sphingomonadales bacterium]|nr:EAL domain-containing protein [Sphingomonadales bacterium]MDE2168869.1 EAL domain-containing protein [Sphingomonadales bacterium]
MKVVHVLRRLFNLYRLETGDGDLLRAQFRALIGQLPILYFALACNTIALACSVSVVNHPLLVIIFAVALCTVCAFRGVWWWQRRLAYFSESQIRRHIRNTAVLSLLISAAFMIWGLLLYGDADDVRRGQIAFFLAITQISCVICLMPLPVAALRVATVGTVPFCVYFLWIDPRDMFVEAINFALVAVAIVLLMFRQHRSFEALVRSRRDLRRRQVETRKLSDENRRIALTDALSGLPNRRALLARLDELREHEQTPGHDGAMAVIFLDLDGFKDINDAYGHEIGDAVIRRVASVLSEVCSVVADRARVMLVRLGGDEFAALVEGEDAPARAATLAADALVALGQTILVDNHEFHIGASIGVAGDDRGEVGSYELMRRADTAMYRAKSDGKGGIRHYHAGFDADRRRRQQIEADLRGGLTRGEFDVAYQALVDAMSGELLGVEAFLRWPGRPGGALMPDAFMEIAEVTGLVHPLGRFVLRRACEEVGTQPGLMLCVNVSPAQFRHPGFEADVARILEETGFPPQRLQIEITEGYLVDHPDRARHAILAFQQMGVTVALDDFGTGFASIGYLQSYGFDCVKLDTSLSARLGRDPRAAMLVSGMIHMARGLDMRVVAEGVESEMQAGMLRLAGCDVLQGYHFGWPSSLRDVLGSFGLRMVAASWG